MIVNIYRLVIIGFTGNGRIQSTKNDGGGNSAMFPSSRLPYFEAVLNELYRIVSLAPLAVPHVASQDTQIEGYAIPKVRFLRKKTHEI